MNLFITIALTALSSTLAFTLLPQIGRSNHISSLYAEKINSKIDLDSPKVVNNESLEPGEKKVYCRCWLSGTFPLCDASHVAHNKETGDNVGPLIVAAPKEE
mmetsp:Transcript_1798/g.2589  ORF Transcript_1798/g.2589 Transcript_1798/m.2589 type:complete len:102 (+) Transcript_1798:90-395(+)